MEYKRRKLRAFGLTVMIALCASGPRGAKAQEVPIPPPPPTTDGLIEEPPPTQPDLEQAAMTMPKERIPGTRVWMAIPPGFTFARAFCGLEHGDEFGISVMDLPEGDFERNTRNYTKKKFEEKGLEVLQFDRTEQAGYPAIRAAVRSPVDGTVSHQLTFGDTTFSVFITTVSGKHDPSVHQQMEWVLGTVSYDKSVVVGTYEGTTFRFDDRRSSYKFAKRGGGAWVYSKNGVDKENYVGEGMMLAMPVPMPAGTTCEGLALKQLQGLEAKGFVRERTEREENRRTNGFPSYSVVHHGLLEGTPTMLYFQVFDLGGMAVMCFGRSDKDFKRDLAAFKELTSTISKQ